MYCSKCVSFWGTSYSRPPIDPYLTSPLLFTSLPCYKILAAPLTTRTRPDPTRPDPRTACVSAHIRRLCLVVDLSSAQSRHVLHTLCPCSWSGRVASQTVSGRVRVVEFIETTRPDPTSGPAWWDLDITRHLYSSDIRKNEQYSLCVVITGALSAPQSPSSC